MPRCNLKRIVISLFLFGSASFFVILSCRTSNWLPHDPWKFQEKEVKLVAPLKLGKTEEFQGKRFNHSFHLKPAYTNTLPNKNNSSINNQPPFQNFTFNCGIDGILTVKSGGRLGNLMGEYATLWALAKRDSFFPILQQRTYQTLHKYFLNPTIAPIFNLNCSLKWHSMNLHVYNKLTKEKRKQLAIEGIFIDGYPTSVSLFHRHRKNIIKEFQFKKEYVERSQSELHKLRGNRLNVVFVSIL